MDRRICTAAATIALIAWLASNLQAQSYRAMAASDWPSSQQVIVDGTQPCPTAPDGTIWVDDDAPYQREAPTQQEGRPDVPVESPSAGSPIEMPATLEPSPTAPFDVSAGEAFGAVGGESFAMADGSSYQGMSMAGDFFGIPAVGQTTMSIPVYAPEFDSTGSMIIGYVLDDPEVFTVDLPPLAGLPGAFVGRQKLAEGGSLVPRDRLIYSFTHFSDTTLGTGGANPIVSRQQSISRNMLGFEKALASGHSSVELRALYANTLSSNLATAADAPPGASVDQLFGNTEGELGNVTLYWKLFEAYQFWGWGAGLGVALPTAEDVSVRLPIGTTALDSSSPVLQEALRVENESVHLLPYFGFSLAPTNRTFAQMFVQFDIDTNGNPVLAATAVDPMSPYELRFVDRLHDTDLVYVDFSVGHWIYRDNCMRHGCTGIAPIFEIHYNASIDEADGIDLPVPPGGNQVTSGLNQVGTDLEVTNAVIGGIFEFGQDKQLLLSYATPIAGDDQFKGEFRVQFHWLFGVQGPPRYDYSL